MHRLRRRVATIGPSSARGDGSMTHSTLICGAQRATAPSTCDEKKVPANRAYDAADRPAGGCGGDRPPRHCPPPRRPLPPPPAPGPPPRPPFPPLNHPPPPFPLGLSPPPP